MSKATSLNSSSHSIAPSPEHLQLHQPAAYLIAQDVSRALEEDIQTGDITAELIPQAQTLSAKVISREKAIMAGRAWAEASFLQVDASIEIDWQVQDGEPVTENQTLFIVKGNARAVLTAERTALNFLQTLMGIATRTHRYSSAIAHTPCKLLDTRKTLPGLRRASKYATVCGGAWNHRIGLYDAYLIKENHIHAAGSIRSAVEQAKHLYPDRLIEVETENLQEAEEAATAGAGRIMLDNFTLEQVKTAQQRIQELTKGKCQIEISGDITEKNIVTWAETGADYVSVGALTKHVTATDLSMRFL